MTTNELTLISESGAGNMFNTGDDVIQVLQQATKNGGDAVRLAGPKNPYPDGPLGVIEEGAYADILLVKGNPLENILILRDYKENIHLIMKDGKVYKNEQ